MFFKPCILLSIEYGYSGEGNAKSLFMTQMIALIGGLPEAASLLLLGMFLLVAGLVLRKALRAYERVAVRKEVPAFKGTHTKASLQATQVSS